MKLVIVILSNKDVSKVLAQTSAQGYFSTKISTSGQFLENGNTTILFGIEEEKIDALFELIEKNITKRIKKQFKVQSTVEGSLLNEPVYVDEYGAVAFVIDVEQFRKL